MKCSVIIPVYNSEKYLEKCIDSLLAQSLTDCEFIFVNDGSTDDSLIILEEFQKIDRRIIIFSQENQGVSAARNVGIRKAKGDYLGFVDADDYVASDFLETLYSTVQLNDVQIVISNFNTEIDGQLITNIPLFDTQKRFESLAIKEHIVPFFIEQDGLNTACNKLYSRELFVTYGLHFPEGVSHGEDGLMNIQAFYYANAVCFINYNGYFYREVSNSATRNLMSKDYFKLALHQYSINYTKDYGINFDGVDIEFLKSKRLISTVYSLIFIYLNSKNSLQPSYRKKYVSEMISNELLQFVVRKYWDQIYKPSNRYHKFILLCIVLRFVFGLKLAVVYVSYRNKI